MVEHQLPKLRVAGSNPVSRSMENPLPNPHIPFISQPPNLLIPSLIENPLTHLSFLFSPLSFPTPNPSFLILPWSFPRKWESNTQSVIPGTDRESIEWWSMDPRFREDDE